ncbi:MAG: hypothetical protein ACTSYD_08260 [Candidatus Heimdallarchaeaceae archaeon]
MKIKNALVGVVLSAIFVMAYLTTVNIVGDNIVSANTRTIVATLTPHDLNWEVGKYTYETDKPLTLITTEGIIADIDPDIHIAEDGSTGDSGVRVGALAEIPVSNGYVNFSCDVRARASFDYAVSLGIKLYDSDTRLFIKNTDSGFYQPGPIDTGWVHRNKQIYVGNYSKVLMLIYFQDGWDADLNQEIFVRNLEVYYLDTVPFNKDGLQTLVPDDFDWTAGAFNITEDNVLTFLDSKGFNYSVSPNIHVKEEGSGTFDANVGVFAEIPLTNGYLNFSCTTRAKAIASTYVSLGAKVFDPKTHTRILSVDGLHIGVYQPDTSDTGYIHHEKSIYIGNYESVLVLFYYLDGWKANNAQEIWIGNLRVSYMPPTTQDTSTVPTTHVGIQNTSIFLTFLLISLTIALKRRKMTNT